MRLLGLALSALLASSCVVVVTSDCHNGLRDGDETDIDCGGSTCAPCGLGGFCGINRDCTTNFCAAGVCSTSGGGGSCSDNIKNGNETDVDCGGSCAKCAAGKACLVGADCQLGVCTGGLCTPHPTGASVTPTAGDVASIANGSGVNTPAGGFGITASGVGASVTFRVTGLGSSSQDELYGSVWSAGGVTGVTNGCAGNACALSTVDWVSPPYSSSGGTRVDFDLLAPNAPAGFDIDLTLNSQGTPIYLDLYVNGVRVPQQGVVFVSGDTAAERNPATMPFALYSK